MRKLIDVSGYNMVRNNILDKIKPKNRQANKNPAFIRYAAGQDDIKAGYPISRDNQKFIIKVVNIPDFTAFVKF